MLDMIGAERVHHPKPRMYRKAVARLLNYPVASALVKTTVSRQGK